MRGVKAVIFVFLALAANVARAQDSAPSDAAAPDEGTLRARALFTEGVGLAQEGHFTDAVARFREALALRDAPTIRYNLASVLFEEGEYAEAHDLAATLLASTETPSAVRTPTSALEAQIEAASALVIFQLPFGADGDVRVDDDPVADPSRAVALAPGHHVARLEREGTVIAEAQIDAVAGERRTIALEHLAGRPRELTDEWWFWSAIAGGVIVVGVIVGVSAGVASADAQAPVRGNFTPGVITW